jgi:hypothetical protein
MALAGMAYLEFQDRCLKPLGHPSKPLKLFSEFRRRSGRKSPFATTLLPNAVSAPVYGSLRGFVNAGDPLPRLSKARSSASLP